MVTGIFLTGATNEMRNKMRKQLETPKLGVLVFLGHCFCVPQNVIRTQASTFAAFSLQLLTQ